MGGREWAELRAVEILASICAVGLLIGGLVAGIPFLTERVAEVFLYSVCCISAVLIHGCIDLCLRGGRLLARGLVSPTPRTVLEPAAA